MKLLDILDHKKILKIFSFIIYPTILLMIVFLVQFFLSDDKVLRKDLINRILILGGLTYGLADIGGKSKKKLKTIESYIKTNLIILISLLIISALFIIKDGLSFENSIVFGLIAIIFGIISQLNQFLNEIDNLSK